MRIGLNARLFPGNWRPAAEEIAFAHGAGFVALQFPGPEGGLDAERLGASPAAVGEALRVAGVEAVMEMLIRIDAAGRTAAGRTPLEALEANLPAIDALGCTRVHWHLVPDGPHPPAPFPPGEGEGEAFAELERKFVPQLLIATAYARNHGFRFGIEHNEAKVGLFAAPRHCAVVLDVVPDLDFVWDWNHTPTEQLAGYLALAPRMTMLHIADTRLPTVNEHLPLGMGAVDLARYCREMRVRGFDGPAILEIGGLPASGGYGRDTDAALRDSLARLQSAIAAAS